MKQPVGLALPALFRLCLVVAAGGAAGALLRHGLGVAVPEGPGFPGTTFAINVVGSLLLALLPAFGPARRSATWRAALGPGVLGGFTTLSAYADQSRALLADGQGVTAAVYLVGTLAACWVAVLVARSWVPGRTDRAA